ncbi:uncharacterized [Tachysurus ichikawai]
MKEQSVRLPRCMSSFSSSSLSSTSQLHATLFQPKPKNSALGFNYVQFAKPSLKTFRGYKAVTYLLLQRQRQEPLTSALQSPVITAFSCSRLQHGAFCCKKKNPPHQ